MPTRFTAYRASVASTDGAGAVDSTGSLTIVPCICLRPRAKPGSERPCRHNIRAGVSTGVRDGYFAGSRGAQCTWLVGQV
jgi:hypothetical protein